MKKLLHLSLCLLFSVATTKSFSQSTGFVHASDPANQAYFKTAKKTSTNHYISCGVSGSGFSNHEIIYWDSNFHELWNIGFPGSTVLGWIDIVETNDGNFVAMGFNQDLNGADIAIKVSQTGTVLWEKEYFIPGTFLNNLCFNKAAGNDPGFVFGGGACAASSYLVKCDVNGNILWQHEYYISGGSGVESTTSIIAENNAYVIAGCVGFGTQNEAFLTKVDSSGTWTWTGYAAEPTLNQIPTKAIKLSNGNYAVLCQFNSNPNYDQMVWYFNSTGHVIGGKKFTPTTQVEIDYFSLAEVSGGKTIVVGGIQDGNGKYFYMELDPTGSILWQKESVGAVAGFLNGTAYDVVKTNSGNYAIFGSSYQDGRTIAVIDSTGAGYCNSTTPTVQDLAPDAYTDNSVTAIIFAPNIHDTIVNYPGTPITITSAVLCGTTGIENFVAQNNALNVFPNPAKNEINLDFGGAVVEHANVTFYNMLGENVLAVELKNSSTINISQLPDGVYMMETVINGERILKKIIKD